MLTNYCHEIANEYNISAGGVKKIVPDLGDKRCYYINLQLYLSVRTRLVKIHRVLKFRKMRLIKDIYQFYY